MIVWIRLTKAHAETGSMVGVVWGPCRDPRTVAEGSFEPHTRTFHGGRGSPGDAVRRRGVFDAVGWQ
jgi:hypothetical protein